MRRCKPLPCLAACLLVDGDSWLIIISLYYVEGVIKLNLTFSHLCTMLYLSSIKTWVTAKRLNTHKYSIIQHFIYHKCFNNYLCALGWVKRAATIALHSLQVWDIIIYSNALFQFNLLLFLPLRARQHTWHQLWIYHSIWSSRVGNYKSLYSKLRIYCFPETLWTLTHVIPTFLSPLFVHLSFPNCELSKYFGYSGLEEELLGLNVNCNSF